MDETIESLKAEIVRLEALVALYKAERRVWKERTFVERYRSGQASVEIPQKGRFALPKEGE